MNTTKIIGYNINTIIISAELSPMIKAKLSKGSDAKLKGL